MLRIKAMHGEASPLVVPRPTCSANSVESVSKKYFFSNNDPVTNFSYTCSIKDPGASQ